MCTRLAKSQRNVVRLKFRPIWPDSQLELWPLVDIASGDGEADKN